MSKKIYRKFCQIYYRTFSIALSHPKILLLITGLLFVLALVAIPSLKIELRMYDIDDPHFGATKQLHLLADEFNDGNSILLIFHKPNGAPILTGEYCAISSWADQQRRSNPNVLSIALPSDILRGKMEGEQLRYRPRVEVQCQNLSAERFRQPIDLGVFAHSPWLGSLVSERLDDFAMRVTFQNPEQGSSDEAHFDPHWIGALHDDLKLKVLGGLPGLEVEIAGRSSFQWFQLQALEKDFWINAVLFILILLLFRMFWGSWVSGLLFFSTVVISSILTFGMMAFFRLPIDTLTTSLFPLLCIAGLEDFVFVAFQWQKQPKLWRHHFKKLGLPGFFTSFTTIIGFMSLTLSDLVMIKNFGYGAAFAALVEWFVIFFVFPALLGVLKISPNFIGQGRKFLHKLVTRLNAIQLPGRWVKISIIIFLVSLFALPYLVFDVSPRHYFPKGHPQKRSYEYTRESRGWEAILHVLFNDSYNRSANELQLAKMAELPNIVKVDSPYQFIDDLAQGLPPRFYELAQREAHLSDSYYQLFSPWGKTKATIYLRDFDLQPLNRTLRQLRQICESDESCQIIGEGVVFAEYSQKVVSTLIASFATSLALVGLVVLFLVVAILKVKNNRKMVPTVLFSVFWAPVVVIGILAIVGIPINYFNSMFATILVGLTGDNAIQYLFAAREGSLSKGLVRRGPSSIIVTLIALAISLCFLWMTPLPIKSLGVLLFFGFLGSLVGDFWILKSLLPRAQT